jgi:two-component sensor histidine kinase
VENDEGDTFHAGRGDVSGLQVSSKPIFYTRHGVEQRIGSLCLFIDQKQMRREVRRQLGISLTGHSLAMIAVIAAVLLLFRHLVARHLENLALALEGVTHGELEAPLTLHRTPGYPDELHSLVAAINLMRGNVHSYIKERELLVSAIHHRIKNDMCFIKAFLSLQADLSESPEVKTAVSEASQRLSVMSRIYERLYGDENLLEVAMKPLAVKVVADLRESGKLPDDAIRLESDDFQVPTHLSVSMGIILNELLTNAMKYAASPPEPMRIDCGPTIVDAPVKQHRGTLAMRNDGGSVVTVGFPL